MFVDPPKTCSFVGLIKPCHLFTGLFWDAVDSFAGLFDGVYYILVKAPVMLTNSTMFADENLQNASYTKEPWDPY